MAHEKHEDLPEITSEAREKLPPAEFERAAHAGEEAGEKASSFESLRWVLVLAIGAGIVAAIAIDWMLLIPTAALMIWYSIPLIVAARSTAADDAEAEVLRDHIDHPHPSTTKGKAAVPRAEPAEDADEIPPQARG